MPQLNARQPIVQEDRTMTQAMRQRMLELGKAVVITGVGSPEGVVEAEQGQFYMDTTGSAGAVLYTKRDASIGGDAKQGWIGV